MDGIYLIIYLISYLVICKAFLYTSSRITIATFHHPTNKPQTSDGGLGGSGVERGTDLANDAMIGNWPCPCCQVGQLLTLPETNITIHNPWKCMGFQVRNLLGSTGLFSGEDREGNFRFTRFCWSPWRMNPLAPQANFGGTIFVRFRNRVTCWPKEIRKTAKTHEDSLNWLAEFLTDQQYHFAACNLHPLK